MFDDRVAFLGLVPVRTSAQALTHLAPDVALLELPTVEASELAVLIERRWPHVRVAMICEQAGWSSGQCSETPPPATGVDSVLSITTAPVAGRPGDADPSFAARASTLSRREREIAALLAEGYPNREIARRLSIAPATVKNHVHSILTKLGVGTRSRVRGLALLDVPPAGGIPRGVRATTFVAPSAWLVVPVASQASHRTHSRK